MTSEVKRVRAGSAAAVSVLIFCMQGCGAEKSSIMTELELPTLGSDDGSDRSLEVPPDLDPPETQDIYEVVSAREGAAEVPASRVLPRRLGMRLRSEGNVSWLVVGATPDGLWPHLLDFWGSYGFEIVSESMLHGRIETAWREQRLSAGAGLRVRDMFRMRVERAPYGATNVYLANRKATLTDGHWRLAFGDRETEVDILNDLSDYLASRREVKSVDISPLKNTRIRLKLRNSNGAPVLSIGQPYGRVWRRLGVTLDRAGLDVRRADRSRGTYLIRYRPGEEEFAGTGDFRLLRLRLLQRGKETLVTIHPNRNTALSYEVAHEVLRRIIRTYGARV